MGKEQALHCNGMCKGWIHRYCAGVSIAHFESLGTESSAKSFMCTMCMQRDHEEQLRSEVVSLRRELEQLQHETEIEQLRSEVLSLHQELEQLRDVVQTKLSGSCAAAVSSSGTSSSNACEEKVKDSGLETCSLTAGGCLQEGGRGYGVGGRVGGSGEWGGRGGGRDGGGRRGGRVGGRRGGGGRRGRGGRRGCVSRGGRQCGGGDFGGHHPQQQPPSSASDGASQARGKVTGARRIWGTL